MVEYFAKPAFWIFLNFIVFVGKNPFEIRVNFMGLHKKERALVYIYAFLKCYFLKTCFNLEINVISKAYW